MIAEKKIPKRKISYRMHASGGSFFRYYRVVKEVAFEDYFTVGKKRVEFAFAKKTRAWMVLPMPSWQKEITKDEYFTALKNAKLKAKRLLSARIK